MLLRATATSMPRREVGRRHTAIGDFDLIFVGNFSDVERRIPRAAALEPVAAPNFRQ
jgi:hypothetical protein